MKTKSDFIETSFLTQVECRYLNTATKNWYTES